MIKKKKNKKEEEYKEEIKAFIKGLKLSGYSEEAIDNIFSENKKKLTDDINKLKNDPNNKIHLNAVKLKAIMKFIEKPEFEDVLRKNNELKNKIQDLINKCIKSISETLYRSLKSGQKRSNKEGICLDEKGCYRVEKDAYLDKNKVVHYICKQTEFIDTILTESNIECLRDFFKKYKDSGLRDYRTEDGIKDCFDKECVESLILNCPNSITVEKIKLFFEGKETELYYDAKIFVFQEKQLRLKNPVTRSLINHANLDKNACIFIIKELNLIEDINSMDLLFKNKKIMENETLCQAIIEILREKPGEFKQHPAFLQKVLEHINDFDMEQIKKIETYIEKTIPDFINESVNPNLITILIKNTDLTSSKNIDKAELVLQKIIALDPNSFRYRFSEVKQPIAVILDSFVKRLGDKNIENILLKNPSILCNAVENNNVEIVEYCLKHGMFNLFFLEDKSRKNTPLQLINSKPVQRFNKMRSLIEKYKKELDDCQKQMEVEANKPKKPQPQPQPEVKNPQPKPKTEEEEKNEEQDAQSNKKDMNEIAQNLIASRKTKDVLEKLNKLSKYNETENIGEYKKIFSDFLLKFVYGTVIYTTILNKTLELLVEKLSDAQKIMLFSILASTIPEKLSEVKDIFGKAVKPEQQQAYDKIYSKAKHLANLFEANQRSISYYERVNKILIGIRA